MTTEKATPLDGIFIVGCCDTGGSPARYSGEIRCVRLGSRLVSCVMGATEAVMDSYGDWVSPRMASHGLKCKMMLEVRDATGTIEKVYP